MTDVNQKDSIGVLGFPFCKGQPRGGTEQGPKALRDGGMLKSLESLGTKVTDHGDLVLDTVSRDDPVGILKNPRTVAAANKRLSEATCKLLKQNQRVVTLGGDHSMAIGSIHGHASAEPDLVVVWVDAHADINTPLTTYTGNIHGMPLSFVVKELKDHMPDVPGFDWAKPCISAKDIVFIGLRDVDPAERRVIEEFGIQSYSMQEVDKYGIRDVVDRALQHVDPCGTRPIHVSFDVDAVDPDWAASTGTPVAGGLSLRESFYIAEEIAKTGRLSVLDVAEVNPRLGNEEMQKSTVKTAIDVTTKFCGDRRQGNATGCKLPRPQ